MDRQQLLAEVAEEIRTCPRCRLAQTRTHAVPGEGNPRARLMFVGEGPGQQEDHSGRPFVGPAGQLLDELLHSAGIRREDVFITNIVKCRPPQNRDPLPDEVAACNVYLMAQIALIEPLLICPLGSPALKTLLGQDRRIGRDRCRIFRRQGILYFPLYHPAAALHQRSLAAALQDDILKLKELINRPINQAEIIYLDTPAGVAAPAAEPAAEPGPQPAAMSLF